MALCVNQSGTWREISTQCVKQSGTWRQVATGCINQSGTWREFGFGPDIAGACLGDSIAGGILICKASSIGWIIAPTATEVVRNWYCRNDAVTTAQASAPCGDWFIPTQAQLENPAYQCRTYWFPHSKASYWSSQGICETGLGFVFNSIGQCSQASNLMTNTWCVRAFRCVSY